MKISTAWTSIKPNPITAKLNFTKNNKKFFMTWTLKIFQSLLRVIKIKVKIIKLEKIKIYLTDYY